MWAVSKAHSIDILHGNVLISALDLGREDVYMYMGSQDPWQRGVRRPTFSRGRK